MSQRTAGDLVRIEQPEPGIVKAVWLTSEPIDGEEAKTATSAVAEAMGDRRMALLVDLRRCRGVDRDARDIFAAALPADVAAKAFLVDSALTKTLAMFVISVSSPPYPTTVWSDEDEAMTWLRSQLN